MDDRAINKSKNISGIRSSLKKDKKYFQINFEKSCVYGFWVEMIFNVINLYMIFVYQSFIHTSIFYDNAIMLT